MGRAVPGATGGGTAATWLRLDREGDQGRSAAGRPPRPRRPDL